jgi:hypothetical protein
MIVWRSVVRNRQLDSEVARGDRRSSVTRRLAASPMLGRRHGEAYKYWLAERPPRSAAERSCPTGVAVYATVELLRTW